MKRVSLATGAVVLAVLTLAGCGSSGTTTSDSSGGASSNASKASTATTTSADSSHAPKDEACTLVPASLLQEHLKLDVGKGEVKTTPAPDLSGCKYTPDSSSFVLVQTSHSADSYFPANLYPPKGLTTVPIPGADRGYALRTDPASPIGGGSLLVVKGDRAIQITIVARSPATSDDLVALGEDLLKTL